MLFEEMVVYRSVSRVWWLGQSFVVQFVHPLHCQLYYVLYLFIAKKDPCLSVDVRGLPVIEVSGAFRWYARRISLPCAALWFEPACNRHRFNPAP